MQPPDVMLTPCCRSPDNVSDTLPPNSRSQKSRRSASASIVARPVTGGAAMAARRGTSLRLHSKEVAVSSPFPHQRTCPPSASKVDMVVHAAPLCSRQCDARISHLLTYAGRQTLHAGQRNSAGGSLLDIRFSM